MCIPAFRFVNTYAIHCKKFANRSRLRKSTTAIPVRWPLCFISFSGTQLLRGSCRASSPRESTSSTTGASPALVIASFSAAA